MHSSRSQPATLVYTPHLSILYFTLIFPCAYWDAGFNYAFCKNQNLQKRTKTSVLDTEVFDRNQRFNFVRVLNNQ